MTPRTSTREPLEVAPGLHVTPEGAAWIPSAGTLAVTDLHLGYEAHYRSGGAVVPDHGADKIFEIVTALLERYRPECFVVNGDVKHAFSRELLHEKRAVAQLEATVEAAGCRFVPVRGNHDAHLEKMVRAPVVDTYRVEGALFAHGHAPATPAPGEHLVLGHEHPAITVRDAVGIGFRLPAILHHPTERIVVLPALSPWAAGVDPLTRGFSGPNLKGLDPREFEAYAFESGELFPFGTLESISLKKRKKKR